MKRAILLKFTASELLALDHLLDFAIADMQCDDGRFRQEFRSVGGLDAAYSARSQIVEAAAVLRRQKRGRPANICRVHDSDDPVAGRICGRPQPCPEHPRKVGT